MRTTDPHASDRGCPAFPDDRPTGLGTDVERRFFATEPGDSWYYPSGLSPIAELACELGLIDQD